MLETRAHRNLFYVAALPVLLLNLPRFAWQRIGQSRIAQLALAYFAYFLAAALWSDGLSGGALADLLRVTLLALLFFLVILHLGLSDAGFAGRFFACYAAVAGLSLLAVFAATAMGLLPAERRFIGFGLASHPVIGATLYGVALLAAAFTLLPRASSWRLRATWLGVIALCTAFMLLSGSRGPLLALTAALVAGLVIADRRLALAVAALLATGVALGLVCDFRPIELLYQRSQSGHFEIWGEAIAAITERPWLGYGSLTDLDFTGKHGSARSPHNLLLANHIYGGLPATLLLLGILALATVRAWRVRRQQPALLVLLIFGVAASLFDTRSLVQNLGREWITLWLPLGLLAAAEVTRRER